MSKTLRELFAPMPEVTLPSALARSTVRGLAYDSRKVQRGHVFFAFPGAKADGRAYAAAAMEAGALAVVSELPPPEGFKGPWIQVPHGRQALAVAAREFHARPDTRIALTGITGTNGKTTTSYLIDSVLRTAGFTTALIGTIEYRLGGKKLAAENTTPESLDLITLFSELEKLGGTHATLEASSHALELRRIHALQFHTAVFTNLTRDHLDFHRTMEAYFAAKQLLFVENGEAAPRYAVVNRDDGWAKQLRFGSNTEVVWYGLEEGATARAQEISSGFTGLRFQVDFRGRSYALESALAGQVNVYNVLAAWCAGMSYGLAPEVVAEGIAACKAVPGRFERVDEGQPFLVVVDYAHTDDALRNTLRTARQLSSRKVITLFGCGGDRDREKRPMMGMAAAELSDYVVLTSDNPRSEDPLQIMNDALVGIRRFDTPHVAEPDREAGIRKAIEQAAPGDVVVLAGKGHETYQTVKGKNIPFDDREAARRILRGFGYG